MIHKEAWDFLGHSNQCGKYMNTNMGICYSVFTGEDRNLNCLSVFLIDTKAEVCRGAEI